MQPVSYSVIPTMYESLATPLSGPTAFDHWTASCWCRKCQAREYSLNVRTHLLGFYLRFYPIHPSPSSTHNANQEFRTKLIFLYRKQLVSLSWPPSASQLTVGEYWLSSKQTRVRVCVCVCEQCCQIRPRNDKPLEIDLKTRLIKALHLVI